MIWLFIHIYYKMNTICLFHHTHKFFFLWWELVRIIFSKFQICNTVLTIVTMLYIASPWLMYFVIGILNLLTPFTHFIPPYFWQPPISSIYDRFFFFLSFHTENHTVFVFLWLISFSPQGPFMLSQMVSFHYFIWLNNIPLYE